jgi:hypothetical protein
MQILYFAQTLRAVSLAVVLTACGGGGDGSSGTGGGVSSTLTGGTAATGAPLANASVSLLCNTGGVPITSTTNAQGKYTATLPAGCAAPYIFKATGTQPGSSPPVSLTLYGFADAPANINITPFTDITARMVTANDPAAAYDAVAAGSQSASDYWNATNRDVVKAKFLALLATLGPNINLTGITDVLHQIFTADGIDVLDRLLDAFKVRMGAVSLAALAETLQQNGGTVENQPWRALFPAGVSTLDLLGSDCSVVASDVTVVSGITATLRLTRDASSVQLSVVPDAATSTATFPPLVVGQAFKGFNSGFELRSRFDKGDFLNPSFALTSTDLSDSFVASFQSNKSTGEQSFFINTSGALLGNTTLSCNKVDKPFVRSALKGFQAQARLASYIQGSPSEIITSALRFADGCEDNSTTPSIFYRYSASPQGNLNLNGVFVPPDWLDSGEFPQANYYENVMFDQNGLKSSFWSTGLSDTRGLSLIRDIQPVAGFGQQCGLL